jgi:hypothetical protein
MADIAPLAHSATSTAKNVPREGWVYDNAVSSVPVSTAGLKHQVWYFSLNVVDDGETWTSGIKGLVCCAFQCQTPATADGVSLTWTRAGVVTFYGGDDNPLNKEGWLHTWSTGA